VFNTTGRMVLEKLQHNLEKLKHDKPETHAEDIAWLLLTIPSLLEWEGMRLW